MKMHPLCQGNHTDLLASQSRREFIQIGAIAGLGLTLPEMLKLRAIEMPKVESYSPIAESVIHIYLPGGNGSA